MAANMYRVGDYVYFETSSTTPYQIRRIDELCKTATGNVEAKVTCFFRRRDLSSSLIALADKHHAMVEDGLEDTEANKEAPPQVVKEKEKDQLDERKRHQLKCHEVFLSRQVETLPATHIRGKCSVTLLSDAESPLSYLGREDTFFYSLVYDSAQKSLIADHGEIRVGTRYQVEIFPDLLADGESDGRNLEDLEELVWDVNRAPGDQQIDQLMIISRAIGTFSRALDSTSAVRQPSLHMSAAAASRDITLFHAMDTLHKHNYNLVSTMGSLVSSTGPVLCRDEMEEWSAAEANMFEEALDKYGKNFREIRQDLLPWKSHKSMVEYYYMWKTTDRYVQQKRIKAAEAERKLKQVYIPPYNKPNPAQIPDKQNGPEAPRPCESCFTTRSNQWFAWGPPHMACRLCASCWTYWKKYGGLKRPASRSAVTQERSSEGNGDGQSGVIKIQRCTLPNCGKEFRTKSQLVRHLGESHGLVLPVQSGAGGGTGGTDSPVLSLTAGGSAVKTRAAFCLVTTPLTRLSRQLCHNVLNVRRSARKPFHSINIAAIKLECQQRLPNLLKKVKQLQARKRATMMLVSARLGIDVHVDKPALLNRSPPSTDPKPPMKYAFPAAPNYQQIMPGHPVNRKRNHEHLNGTDIGVPAAKRPATQSAAEPTQSSSSIKTTEPKMRGSSLNIVNGGVPASRMAGVLRGRKNASLNADCLDDVCFKANDGFRKQRKQQVTTQVIRRGARKPWRPLPAAAVAIVTPLLSTATDGAVTKLTNDSNVILLD